MINERETHFLSFISIYTAHVNAAPVTAHVNAARVTAHVNAARVTAHLNWKLNAPYLEDDEYYCQMFGLCRHNESYNQVFKCLAYVDTMRVMNTKMLADMQRKLLNFKLSINSCLFWGNTQLLKMPQVSNKVIPNWKGQYPIEWKSLGI